MGTQTELAQDLILRILTGPLEPTNAPYAIAKIAGLVGYTGPIADDSTKPDGTPQKQLDVSHLASLGWRAEVMVPAR